MSQTDRFGDISRLVRDEGGKIILLVIDGLGGLPHPERGITEMEAAEIPNLDALAARASVGRLSVLGSGLTPGSGPGHLSLFGYDPRAFDLGRGVLEALGSDYPLTSGEIAARGNLCTLDGDGIVLDRRAERPTDEECRALCEELTTQVKLASGEFQLLPGKQHRFTLILRGAGLGHHLNDNDPQVTGKPPLLIEGEDEASQPTADIVADFLRRAREVLRSDACQSINRKATGMLLRGFSSLPEIPTFEERFGLRAAAIAIYPMYRGVARLVGMDVVAPEVTSMAEQIAAAGAHWNDYDFFFLHAKDTDTAGHGGDFEAKVKALKAIDREIPGLLDLGADVTLITGDHSTPTLHREHSWHPVPVLVASARALPVPGTTFSERGVLPGELQTLPATDLMVLALAHAGRLDKYGA